MMVEGLLGGLLIMALGQLWNLHDMRKDMERVAEACTTLSETVERLAAEHDISPAHEAVIDAIADLKESLKPRSF